MAKKSSAAAVPYNSERDWRAESDMRTLCQAEEIKNDSKRLKAAKACAMRQLEEIETAFGEDDEKDDKK